jgi:Ca2+-transporting ATPase
MVYMGSVVVYGRGAAVVTATGMETEMGKIADALEHAEQGETPLQIKLSQLSKILTWLVLGICVLIFGVQILRAGGFSGEVILNSFMIAVSLAVAAIPEGLVAVVTVVLSIGVTNMSKRNAIISRLTAVETLGCAQIICSDKTGTLTQNKMTVVDRFGDDEKLLATAMALCSDAELDEAGDAVGEPTECALVNYATSLGLNKDELKDTTPRIGEAPVRQRSENDVHRPSVRRRHRPVYEGRAGRGAEEMHPFPEGREASAAGRRRKGAYPRGEQRNGGPGAPRPRRRLSDLGGAA